MDYEVLISFIGASMLLTIMPGPDIIYVLMQSITNGKKYGIATALGLVSGIFIHTSLVAFGVSAIIKENENLYFIIKLFGALYLVYLAYQTYISKEDLLLNENVPKKGLVKLYKQGFLMNVLNPKVTIFFLAFFPGFLFSENLNNIVQFYVLGFIFIIQAIIIFIAVAFFSNYISTLLKNKSTNKTFIKLFKVLIYIGLALFIFFS